MAVRPTTRRLPIVPIPPGQTGGFSEFARPQFKEVTNWWPVPEEQGAMQVVPGFAALSSTEIDSSSPIISTLGFGQKSDGTRVKFAVVESDTYTVTDSGTAASIKGSLTARLKTSIVTYGDLVLFFNGADTPWKYDFSSVSDIGLTQPDVSSSAAALDTSTADDNNVKGVVEFWVTFVRTDSDSVVTEGPLSDSFGQVDAGTGAAIDLTGIPTDPSPPAGGSSTRRIYRSLEDDDDPFLAGTIDDNTGTTITLTDPDTELGGPPNSVGDPPPSKLHYAIVYMNRVWASGDSDNPNTVYYSELQEPEGWDDERFKFDVMLNDGDTITAIARHPQGVLVFKNHHIYLIRTKDPQAQLPQLDELTPADQNARTIGTPSHWGVVAVPEGVVFYYHGAFWMIDNNLQIQNISSPALDDELPLDIDDDQIGRIQGVYWPRRDQVWISMPTGSSNWPDRTYIWHRRAGGAWTKMDTGFAALAVVENSSDGTMRLWGAKGKNPTDTKVYRLDHPTATTFAGETVSADLEIEAMFMGDPGKLTRWMWLEQVFEQSSASVGITVTLDGDTGNQITATADLSLSGHDRVQEYMSINQRARDIAVKWNSNDSSARAKILAAVVEGKPTASRRR